MIFENYFANKAYIHGRHGQGVPMTFRRRCLGYFAKCIFTCFAYYCPFIKSHYNLNGRRFNTKFYYKPATINMKRREPTENLLAHGKRPDSGNELTGPS